MLFGVLAFFCFLELSFGLPTAPRIVNGTDAAPGEIPYIVSLRINQRHTCGGSIVTERFVLTAAHCVTYAASYYSIQYGLTAIVSGADAPNVIAVSRVVRHENYVSGRGYINDIAVVELQRSIPLSDTVQRVRLPAYRAATPENSPALLSGWGYPYTNGSVMTNLQRVDIMVFPDADCERIHASTGPTSREYHVCAGVPEGGKGQCSGDSGGPLVANGVQVGIVSWSVKPCTIVGYPGVFAKVSSYINWITNITGSILN